MAWYEKITDNFNRENENPLASPWAYSFGNNSSDLKVISNELVGGAGGPDSTASYYHTTELDSDNNYARAKYIFITDHGRDYPHLLCRGNNISSGSTASGYVFLLLPESALNYFRLYRVVDNSWTQLGSNFGSVPDANFMKVSADGTTITGYYSTDETAYAYITDSTNSTGKYTGISIMLASGVTYGKWDDFSAGDDVAPSGHPTMSRWGGVPYMTIGRRKW
jgi:hypothetical protein